MARCPPQSPARNDERARRIGPQRDAQPAHPRAVERPMCRVGPRAPWCGLACRQRWQLPSAVPAGAARQLARPDAATHQGCRVQQPRCAADDGNGRGEPPGTLWPTGHRRHVQVGLRPQGAGLELARRLVEQHGVLTAARLRGAALAWTLTRSPRGRLLRRAQRTAQPGPAATPPLPGRRLHAGR